MPVVKRSLAITDAYRRDLASLSRRVEVDARRSWRQLDWADLDRSYVPVHAALTINVTTAQRDAVRLTAGYLGAYLTSELGERVSAPVLNTRAYVGKSFTDGDLNEALRGPLIKVKVANKQGQPDPMGTGFKSMLATVDVNVKHAARQSLQDAMEADDRIVGWKRAIRGTCDACSGLADGESLPPGTPLEIHPNCECVAEAIVNPRTAGDVLGDRSMGSVIGPTPRGVGERSPFTAADRKALANYVGTEQSFRINEALRAGEVPTSAIKAIDRAMEHAGRVGSPVRVYRMAEADRVPTESVFSDAGFGSATANAERGSLIEREMTRFTLDIHPDVKAVWGANPTEQELVLQRGCRYVIRSIKHEGNRWQVEAVVLPPK